jgi:mono/diheme cytochrome c family protein
MNPARRPRIALAVVISGMVASAGVSAAAGQGATAGIYTDDQAQAGRAVYERECAQCHQANLQGSFEAPQLAGESFLRFWGDLSPRDLFDRIRNSMPPESPGGLGETAYLGVVAYLLQANGAPAGTQPLTGTTSVAIASVANGATPSSAAAARK